MFVEEKRYRAISDCYREKFGGKVAKIALDGGFTCPTRDGSLGTGGCIFCSGRGSGDFASSRLLSITEQIHQRKTQTAKKWTPVGYIAYFQAFTNTYAPVSILRAKYEEALACDGILGLSIATRPDCLSEEILDLLEEINEKTSLWVELGLQSAKEETAAFIRRGYSTAVFDEAVRALAKRNISVVAHLILGLPKETENDLMDTIHHINRLPLEGVKLQLLHILKDTDLAALWEAGQVPVLSEEEYLLQLCAAISHLREDITIHRLTGDGPRQLLLAPLWSLNKKQVRNHLAKKLKEENIYQGMFYSP